MSNLYIGCAGDLSYGYTGYIDDFKIWNRALPAADISLVLDMTIQLPKILISERPITTWVMLQEFPITMQTDLLLQS